MNILGKKSMLIKLNTSTTQVYSDSLLGIFLMQSQSSISIIFYLESS